MRTHRRNALVIATFFANSPETSCRRNSDYPTALFTEEEWVEKNQWYAEDEETKLDSRGIDVTREGSTRAKVTVDRTFISRDTYFVWEDGR